MKGTGTTRSSAQKISLLLLLMSALLAAGRTAAEGASFEPAPLAPQWQTALPGIHLSTNSPDPGADGPIIAISPDGAKMMTVFNRRNTSISNRDPYSAVYDFNSQSWSPPTPVIISANSDSAQASLTYDANNVAHLIWEEPGPGNTTGGLAYMRNNGSGWTALKFIAPATSRFFGTAISATGSQTLDAVWAASPDPGHNPNIYHSRSTNGGNTWSNPQPIAETVPTSLAPKIVHDSNGNAHVVWQESTATAGFEVRYTRGLPWTEPIALPTGAIDNAGRPALAIAGNTLHLAFTHSLTVDNVNFDQWAYYTRCSNNCTQPGNWSAPLNASGQPVRVNESAPFDLIPTIASHEGCTYIFFHGYIEGFSNHEVIWNVNSCDGWSGGGRDQVTGFDTRSIYPRVALHGDDIHLVYEWVSGANHQIYYMKGILTDTPGPGPGPGGSDGDVYLPFVSKPRP